MRQNPNAEETLVEKENTLDSLVRDVRKKIMTLESKDSESHYHIILDSNLIHEAAAYKNLTFIKMFLELFPEKENDKMLNSFDENGLTPLMATAQKSSTITLENGEFRQFVASFIGMGADVDKVNAKTGLSALGHFHSNRHNTDLITSFKKMILYNQEANQIEKLLTPYRGATEADKVIIEADSEELE